MMINLIVNNFPFLYTAASNNYCGKTFTKGGREGMKNLILLVILSLFILPAICSAGKRLQIEEPQFDLNSATSCKNSVDSIYGYVCAEEKNKSGDIVCKFAEGAKIKVSEINKKGKIIKGGYEAKQDTNKNGRFAFCATESGDYLLTINKDGYSESLYYITLNGMSSRSISIKLYKKDGVSHYSEICGSVDSIPEKSTVKISLSGIKTKYQKEQTYKSDYFFSFDAKPGDIYLLKIKIIMWGEEWLVTKKKIKLKQNMTYDLGSISFLAYNY